MNIEPYPSELYPIVWFVKNAEKSLATEKIVELITKGRIWSNNLIESIF